MDGDGDGGGGEEGGRVATRPEGGGDGREGDACSSGSVDRPGGNKEDEREGGEGQEARQGAQSGGRGGWDGRAHGLHRGVGLQGLAEKGGR